MRQRNFCRTDTQLFTLNDKMVLDNNNIVASQVCQLKTNLVLWTCILWLAKIAVVRYLQKPNWNQKLIARTKKKKPQNNENIACMRTIKLWQQYLCICFQSFAVWEGVLVFVSTVYCICVRLTDSPSMDGLSVCVCVCVCVWCAFAFVYRYCSLYSNCPMEMNANPFSTKTNS